MKDLNLMIWAEREAEQIGVRGVPFFVLDRKYAVSGAQGSDHFLVAFREGGRNGRR